MLQSTTTRIKTLKQSNQFISPRSILLTTKSAIQERSNNNKKRTIRPNRSPSLLNLLSQYSSSIQSPFLPTKFRSQHSNPNIHPDQIRWRSPLLKAQARAMICKQAFHWRILRHLFNLTPQSIHTLKQTPQIDQQLPRSTKNLIKQKPNFYDGSLTLDEFQQIPHDPIPRLIQLLGGQERLTVKDKRLLGLFQPPKQVFKTLSTTTNTINQTESDPIQSPPRYSNPTLIPHAFGPYIGRRKPFKGKIRQRNRDAKITEVTQKMVKMDDRILTYRKEWKNVKEKSKPALPF